MSKLGFHRDLRKYDSAKKRFFREAIKLAQKEFKKNFDTESNKETGEKWKDVLRKMPPKILDVTGSLKNQTTKIGDIKFFDNHVTLTINPIDSRGRSYADYHQSGIGTNPTRAFVTQSKELTYEQKLLLDYLFYSIII